MLPPAAFLVEFVGAAQAALPSFSKAQLECMLSGLHAICLQLQQRRQLQAGGGAHRGEGLQAAAQLDAASPLGAAPGAGGGAAAAAATAGPVPALVSSFLLVAREWIV